MMLAIYILSIPAFYFALRQLGRRNDNESKEEPLPEIDYDDGRTAYPVTGSGLTNTQNTAAFGAYTRAMEARRNYYYNSSDEDDKFHWNNKSMVITALVSLIPIANTLAAIVIWSKLFFTHEAVKAWFSEDSKL